MMTNKRPLSQVDYDLLYELKKHGISKDDALGILLCEREHNICNEILEWCLKHQTFTTEDILEFIYSELVEPRKMLIKKD